MADTVVVPLERYTELKAADARATAAEAKVQRLESALHAIRAEVEPVTTRRVRRNGSIKAIVDAALGEAGSE